MRQKNLHLFFCIAYLLDWEFDSYTIHAIFFYHAYCSHLLFKTRAFKNLSLAESVHTI